MIKYSKKNTEHPQNSTCSKNSADAADQSVPYTSVQVALQQMVDHTFKRVLTRDRVPDDVTGTPTEGTWVRRMQEKKVYEKQFLRERFHPWLSIRFRIVIFS